MFVGTRKEFIETYGAFIHKITAGTGILPGTLIAQAFLESSANGKVGGSKLSREANNFLVLNAVRIGPVQHTIYEQKNIREIHPILLPLVFANTIVLMIV